MRHFLRFAAVSAALLFCACGQKETVVKAEADVRAYRNTDAVYSRADFVIPKNSVCFLGGAVYGKTDRFTAVRCENGMKGFVIEDEAFRPVR